MRSLLSNGSLAGSPVLGKSPQNKQLLLFFHSSHELARSLKITLDQTFWKHKNLLARLDLQGIFFDKNTIAGQHGSPIINRPFSSTEPCFSRSKLDYLLPQVLKGLKDQRSFKNKHLL